MSLTRKPVSLRVLLLSAVSVALLAGTAPPAAQATTVSFAPSADYPTGQFPQSVAIGDLNGDGKPDLAMAIPPSNVSVLLNKGDGSFEAGVEYPSGFAPQSLAIGDLNGDGKPDLAVALGSNKVSVLLNNGDGSFAPQVEYAAGSDPVSIAIGDLNGDGKPDLAVADEISESVSVLLNKGDGSFTAAVGYATGSHPLSVKIGDLNGDGKPDLAVANWSSNSVSVLLNKGDGSFEAKVEYPTGSEPYSVAIGDLDGDGKPDLVTANRGSNGVSVLLGKGDGSFEAAVEYQAGFLAVSVAIGDLNGDGKPDLAVVSLSSNSVSVLLGKGDGSFEAAVGFPTGSEPTSLAIGDLNGDGKPDLAMDRYSGSVSVLLNSSVFRGNGTFEPKLDYPTTLEPRSMAIGDLNGDGKPDLAVANYSSPAVSTTVSVLINKGDGTFKAKVDYTTGNTPQSVAIGDLNGDGKLDLAVADATSNAVSILLNNGDGTFKTKVDYPTGSDPTSVAIGDLNGDGKPDLAVVDHLSNKVSVLLNSGSGTFPTNVEYTAGEGSFSVAIGDLNGDGKPDLAVANLGSNKVSVLLNSGSGTFPTNVEYATGSHPIFLAIGDLNGDGKPDLAVSNEFSGSVSILLNNGDGTFKTKVDYPTGSDPTGVAIGDLNGDGKPDLGVANLGSNKVSVLLNSGSGTFPTKADYTTGAGPEGLAIGDLDGDGRPDLAVGDVTSHEVSVLLGNDKFNQTINFTSTAPTNPAVGSANYTVTSTATSGLSVSFSVDPSTTNNACSISGGSTVSFNHTGSCVIAADQAGNADYNPATTVKQTIVVVKAHSTLTTGAFPAGVVIGAAVHDSATLSGATADAGGTITFTAYGPEDADCSGEAAFTESVVVSGDGEYQSEFTPDEAGAYQWVTEYSGDENNEAVEPPCEEPGQRVSVAKAEPTISTTASDGTVGGQILDESTVSGRVAPDAGDQVEFKVYGPDDTGCENGAIETIMSPALPGDPAISSAAYAPTEAGTYHWTVTYTGDVNNEPVSSTCAETSTVSKASPTITTIPGGPVTAGAAIADEAKVEGRVNPQPGAEITFELFGPGAPNCEGSPIETFEVDYEPSDTTVSSGPYATTEAGTYHWSAIYSGDVNNQGASSICTEASAADKATPTISTTATGPVTVGDKIKDSATLAAGYNPTGTIEFSLYGPDDSGCGNAPVTTSGPITVTGNDDYESGEYPTTEAGTYHWSVSYSGDSNNNSASSTCTETSTVSKASPTISTTPGGPVIVGQTLEDEAKVEGRVDPQPGAEIEFKLYPPSDANCTGSPIETFEVDYEPSDTTVSSGPYATTEAGTYHWSAIYSGDVNNQGASSICTEASAADKATPTISTTATGPVTVGAAIEDEATVEGRVEPRAGSEVEFSLYGPKDPTCSGSSLETFTVPYGASGELAVASGPYTTTEAGTYHWTAEYTGDANNEATESPCEEAGETSVVNKAAPTISTTASGEVRLGASVTDKATIAGTYSATGSVVFKLYGPEDQSCTGIPAFTSSAIAVSGSGDYSSPALTPTKTGTYRWVAAYSGDGNNQAVSGACGDAGESVVIASPVCAPVQSQVGNYVPKEVVTGAVPGVRARLKVPMPSEQEVQATLHYRLNGKSHSADLGVHSFDNPGTRNFHVPLPGSLAKRLPLRAKVFLSLQITSTLRASLGCVEPTTSHRKLHTRVVRVLDR